MIKWLPTMPIFKNLPKISSNFKDKIHRKLYNIYFNYGPSLKKLLRGK